MPVLDYYHRPHLASAGSTWPYLQAADGTTVDASVIPGCGAPTRIAIVSGFTEGWHELTHANGRADRVMWDASKLPYLGRDPGRYPATHLNRWLRIEAMYFL